MGIISQSCYLKTNLRSVGDFVVPTRWPLHLAAVVSIRKGPMPRCSTVVSSPLPQSTSPLTYTLYSQSRSTNDDSNTANVYSESCVRYYWNGPHTGENTARWLSPGSRQETSCEGSSKTQHVPLTTTPMALQHPPPPPPPPPFAPQLPHSLPHCTPVHW